MPSTSSNSTAEPTTSSTRGRTLTRTPIAFARRIRWITPLASVVVGAMMIRSTCSSRTSCWISSTLVSPPSDPSSGRGSQPMIVARARLAAIRSRTRSSRRSSPITKHRSAPDTEAATDRARKRPVVTPVNDPSHRAATRAPPSGTPRTAGSRMVIPSANSPVNPRSRGTSSSVEWTSLNWSRSYRPAVLNSSSTRGMPASATASTRLIPNKLEITAVATATLTMSATASSRRFNASRRRSDPRAGSSR